MRVGIVRGSVLILGTPELSCPTDELGPGKE